MANETLTVTEAIVLLGDTDGDGVIDPGETVRISVHITNNSNGVGATDATGLNFSQILNGMTLVNQAGNDVNVSPIAFNDTYSAVGNTLLEVGSATAQTGPQSSVAGHVTDNDLEFFGDTFTVSAVQATSTIVANTITTTSAGGGSVVMVTSGADMGSFTYVSAAGFTGTDTFTYTVRDKGFDGIAGNSDDLVNTATVTVNVSNKVWYVDTSASAGGTGTSTNPFNNLATLNFAGDPDGANDFISLRGSTTANLALEAGQQLVGGGSDLIVGGNTLLAAGTQATLTHGTGIGVTLASGNTVTGLNLVGTNDAGTAIADGGATVGSLTVTNVGISGQGGIIDIDQGGALNVTLNSAASTTSSGVNGGVIDLGGGAGGADGVTGSFTVTGATSITGSHAQNAIEIGGLFAGTNLAASFAGGTTINLIGGSAGVAIVQNAGSESFAGIDVTTTTGNAFVISSAGTLTVTGADNDVSTTTGQLLSIDSTTLGAGNAAFDTLAASGTVTGNALDINNLDGGALTVGGNVTIANSTGDGINIRGGSSTNFAFNGATDINGATGDGVELNGANGTATFVNLQVDAVGGNGMQIVGATNTVTVTTGGIGASNDPAGDGVNINGGTGAVAIGASITKTSAGNVVEVNDHETGNVTFSGTLAGTGGTNNGIFVTNVNTGTVTFSAAGTVLNTGTNAAVTLTSNTGGTINFTGGGLDIDTTSGTGFNATGGGTVNVTGSNNTIAATSGSALNINATTIGASDATFARIDSGAGANNGISLVNTGTAGGVKVTGTGAAGSGGTIAGKTGADGSTTSGIGIYLENTSEFSIDRMSLSNFDNNGIFGKSVGGIRVLNTTIGGTIGTSSGSNDAAVAFGTDSGNGSVNGFANGSSSLFDAVDISGGIEHNVEVYQSSGTYNLTIRNSSVHDNSAALGGDGILIETYGTAHGIVRVATTDFDDNKSQAVQANALADSHLELTLHDNDISASTQGNEGFVLQNAGNGDLTVAVTNNVFGGTSGTSIQGTNIFVGNVVNNASNSAFLNATISGNSITQTAGVNRPLVAFLSSNLGSTAQSVSKVLIDNNIVDTSVASEGIFVSTPDPNTAPLFHATVTNNVVVMNNVNSLRGIAVQATQGVAGQGATGIAQISGNDVQRPNGNVGTPNDIRIRQANPGGGATNPTMTIDPFTSGSAVAGTVVDEDNPLSTGESAGTVTVANGVIQAPSSPATPGLPAFLEAGGAIHDDAPAGGGDAPPPPTGDTPVLPDTPSDPTLPPDGEVPPADEPAPGASVIVDDGYVSQAELDFFVDAAMQRWIATGLTPEQIAALEALTFSVAQMPGQALGSFDNGVVKVDDDAAGRGWFADATPLEDSEFATVVSETRLVAAAGAPAAGRYDLLTTVLHEMGHALGLNDLLDAGSRDNLLYGYLFAGERRLPGGDEADGATVGSVTQEAFAGGTVAVVAADGTGGLFNLPAGRFVDIQWDAVIDGQVNKLITNPVNSGTVTATNAVGFPDVTSNIVTTVLDTLTLGGTVWSDSGAGVGGVRGNGLKDGTEAGVAAVTVTLFADTGSAVGVWDNTDVQLATSITVANGDYSFTGLAPGNYIVRVDLANFNAGAPLVALQASSVTVPEPIDPNTDVDNDDNGVRTPGQAAYSNTITLSYGGEPAGLDINTTLDFGFVAPNAAPTSTNLSGDTATFTEGAATVQPDVANNATIADADSANFDGGSLTIEFTAGEVAAEDQLSIAAVGTITSDATTVSFGGTQFATWTGGTGGTPLVFTFDADATPAAVQSLVRAIRYANSGGEDPTDGDRTLSWTLVDGDGTLGGGTDTLVVTTTVDVDSVNDAPAGGDETIVVNEDDSHPFSASDFNFTDTDNDSLLEVIITTLPAAGTLLLSGVPITVAGAVVTAVQIAAGDLTFEPAANANGTGYASFTFQVRDTGGTDNGGVDIDPTPNTITFNVTALNDAPVNVPGATVNISEDAVGVVLSTTGTAMSVSDVEATGDVAYSLSVAHGTLNINTGVVGGVAAGDVTGNGTGAIAIQGTIAEINITLASSNALLYTPDADYNGSDTLEVYANDAGQAGLDTNAASVISPAVGAVTEEDYDLRAINIAAINDVPVLDLNGAVAGIDNTAAYTENAGASVLAGALTVADVDDANLEGATVSIGAGFQATTDVLTIGGLTTGTTSGIGFSYDGTTGVLTLTGSAALADYQAVLRQVAFHSTSDAPGASRAIGWLTTDGDLTTGATTTLTITQANDAATITGDGAGNVTEAGGVANGTAGTPTDTGDLNATDPDNAADLWQVVSAGAATTGGYGTYELSAAGVWIYTLDDGNAAVQGLNGAATLSDTFTALTQDGTSQLVTVTIHAQNDAAAITGDATGDVTEAGGTANGTPGVASDTGDLDAADPDNTADGWQAVAPGGATTGGYGTYALTAAGVWTYTLDNSNAAVQGLNGAATLSDTFTALTADGTSQLVTVTIHAQDDAAVARADSVTTDEASVLAGSVFADNGSGADGDVDGPPLMVATVNGSAASVGTQIALASGALLTVNADGTFDYDPNGAFDVTPAPGSGASNTPASDSFAYTLAGGDNATVTVTITGVDTDDILLGTAGADVLSGGGGNDRYFVTSGDAIVEAPGGGNDTAITNMSYSLSTGQEIELLRTYGSATTADIDLTGNALANTILGNAGANVLDGKAGADLLRGFAGDDTYFVDNASDRVVEAINGGNDAVVTNVSYRLGAGQEIELLRTSGSATTADIDLRGNALANTILGNAGANVLDGKAGADLLRGFAGDDTYFVDNASDSVVEAISGGNDTVITNMSYGLEAGQEIELLRTYGSASTGAIDLTGNALSNTILGNAAVNVLDGKGGADTLRGYAGFDSFTFTSALGASNVDTIVDFNHDDDTIVLDNGVFAGLALGALAAGAFCTGAAAADADDRIIYNGATGQLLFDADGFGGAAAVQFAVLINAPAINASDFLVI